MPLIDGPDVRLNTSVPALTATVLCEFSEKPPPRVEVPVLPTIRLPPLPSTKGQEIEVSPLPVRLNA